MELDIKNYIEAEIPELSDRLSPVFVTSLDGIRVAYTFSDIVADHLNQSQLTLNVICDDYDEGIAIHEKIKGLLAMEEDQGFLSYGDTYFHSELSAGGGVIFNEEIQKWEISKYYIIKWRTMK